MKAGKQIITIVFLVLVVIMSLFLLMNHMFGKSILYLKDEKFNYAVNYLQPLAFIGHSKAQKILGECYAFGHGVDENMEKAKYWLKRASNSNNCNNYQCISSDLYFIGRNYLEGIGVDINREKAIIWIKMAADNGYPKAVEYMLQSRIPADQ